MCASSCLRTCADCVCVCVHDGQNGIVWHRIAEISLLGALGCGAWLCNHLFQSMRRKVSHDSSSAIAEMKPLRINVLSLAKYPGS